MQKYTIYDDPVPKLPDETHPYLDQNGAEMYLASEADARIAELERELDVRKAAIEAQFRLMGRVASLRTALSAAKRSHLVVEDCWYSCPKSGECCNECKPDECDCGADEHNAKIDKSLGL